MRFSHFFVERPIFASVIALFIVIIGSFAYFSLPVSQYPNIAPPTIQVRASYPGASAEIVSQTVATPIEQEINGVEEMLYMTSQATADGNLVITVTFKLGTDLDLAQVLVQNRVQVANPILPQEVQQLGITVQKNSPDILMVIHMSSPDDSLDPLYISNYTTIQIKDILARLEGVASVQLFGDRQYAMRIWLDPEKVAARDLTAGDIVDALRAQNVQIAAGILNQPPVSTNAAYQLNVETVGRLDKPDDFANIIVKTDDQGRITRVRDVGRVELGASNYSTRAYVDGRKAVAMVMTQKPGSNALQTATRISNKMAELNKAFPTGLRYDIIYNTSLFVADSIHEVYRTIFEAILLVVVVVILFLQTWRASIIPIVAIPVSLIGTFAVLAGLGFTLNSLSLFGLVLAIGIVVDDAIVVVENVERNLRLGMSPRDAAHKTMDEVGGALVAIGLVLSAVFVPAAFIPGISGQFFKQFAVTISAATLFSLLVSLTLSPALCALLFREDHAARSDDAAQGKCSPVQKPIQWFFNKFNYVFDKISNGYSNLTLRLIRLTALVLLCYVGLIALTVFQFSRTPVGFIPDQDQGYLITVVQLPPGSSLERTDAVTRRASEIMLSTPGVAHVLPFAGFDGATFTNATNAATLFSAFEPFAKRSSKGLTDNHILAELNQKLGAIEEAFIVTIKPAPVPGIGSAGGFKMMVQDRNGAGLEALSNAVQEIGAAANQTPGLVGVFSLFNTRTPKIFADIDRVRAEKLGVPIDKVSEALEVYLGSSFVNKFNYLGRTYNVTAQADWPYRLDERDISLLKTRNAQGKMVPLGSVAQFHTIVGAARVPRHNLYSAAEVQGNVLPGFSSGYGLTAMEKIANEHLPQGFGYEWTELAFQQKLAGSNGLLVFAASVVFVFLVLAAQYESWSLPLAIILIVPMCLLAAISGLLIRGMDMNILSQVGFVVLVGLAAKNAILIVEFARQAEADGMALTKAAQQAAKTRLRPILMTSFAFIFGVVPLAIATGAGAEMRQSLGTAVLFGMIGVTLFGLIFTPVFYVVVRSLFGGKILGKKPAEQQTAVAAAD